MYCTLLLRIHVWGNTLLLVNLYFCGMVLQYTCNSLHLIQHVRFDQTVAECNSICHCWPFGCTRSYSLNLLHRREELKIFSWLGLGTWCSVLYCRCHPLRFKVPREILPENLRYMASITFNLPYFSCYGSPSTLLGNNQNFPREITLSLSRSRIAIKNLKLRFHREFRSLTYKTKKRKQNNFH